LTVLATSITLAIPLKEVLMSKTEVLKAFPHIPVDLDLGVFLFFVG
jgi:hypothetical protein